MSRFASRTAAVELLAARSPAGLAAAAMTAGAPAALAPAMPAGYLAAALILGAVQGLTEFLPVSSSGHLVVGGQLLGMTGPSLVFDTLLHFGTLLPVLWLYRQEAIEILTSPLRARSGRSLADLWLTDRGLRLLVCIAIATVPTAVIGGLAADFFEELFSSLRAVGVTFIVTGGILTLTRLRPRPVPQPAQPEDNAIVPEGLQTLTPWHALLVGFAQGLAITPGISRSGTTIAAGLLLGIERTMAVRFSFLLSVPAILGAVALQLRKLDPGAGSGQLGIYGAGTLVAAISGYFALQLLVWMVNQGTLHRFAYYLWPLGTVVLLYSLLR